MTIGWIGPAHRRPCAVLPSSHVSASDAEGDCSSGPETVSSETETQPQEPANRGLLGRLREISWFERVRGRPGGLNLNQTVMSCGTRIASVDFP